MSKYIFLSIALVLTVNLFRILLIILVSSFYKEDFKKNIELKPKIIIIESFVLIFLLAFSFWLIDCFFDSKYITVLFSLFFVSLIPSYDYILSPLKYLISKKEFRKNKKLEKIIKNKGFDYKIIILKGKIVNAYATGILPFSRTILIGKSLKKNMNEENLLSIIYHEIGHLKLNHLIKLYFINTLLSLLSFLVFFCRQYYLSTSQSEIYEPISIFALGVVIGILYWYIPGKIQYKLELEADYFASKIVGAKKYEEALIELDFLSNGDVSKGGTTNPNLKRRIKNIYKK